MVETDPNPVPLWKLLLGNLALLLAGLVLMELVFGNWLRDDRLKRLNVLRDETLTIDVSDYYPSEKGVVTYRRDAFGLRGPYESLADVDIFTIGGSTTDQKALGEGETWQDVLAQEFRREGKQVSVVNGGVDGQSTYGHIKNFDWWYPTLPDLRVRYFVLYIGINDMFRNPGYDHDELLRGPGLVATLEANSILYYLFNTLRGLREAYFIARVGRTPSAGDKSSWVTRPRIQRHEDLMADRLRAYRARLRVLLGKAKRSAEGVICVTQPARWYRFDARGRLWGLEATLSYDGLEVNGVDIYHMLRRLNDVTLEVCRGQGATALDPAAEIAWEDGDFYDLYHYTPRGARKIGRYLHAELRHLFQ